jgi:hypothetical protein
MMSSASAARKQYIALKASGVCVRCKVEKAREGRTECEPCSKEHSESRNRSYSKNKPEDLCNSCRRNKPSEGMRMCASCRILARVAARKRAAKESK